MNFRKIRKARKLDAAEAKRLLESTICGPGSTAMTTGCTTKCLFEETTMTKRKPNKYRALRIRTGLNQTAFWSRCGVTQSGGSRYESGRKLSEPVRLLLALAYADDDSQEHQRAKKRVFGVAG